MPGRSSYPADAYHRPRAAIRNAGEHGGKFFVSHRTVLCVDEQPVVSAERELFDDGRAVRVDEQAELRLSLAQLLLEFGATQSGISHDGCLLKCRVSVGFDQTKDPTSVTYGH